MKASRFHVFVALWASVGTVLPAGCWAEVRGAEVTDIALQPGGLLLGQVLDRNGVAQASETVVVVYGEHEVARTHSDENGTFAVAGLRGGQYQIVTSRQTSLVRAWAPQTAPPSATEGTLVIVGDEVVRGQFTDVPWTLIEWCRAHPWLCSITALTAVGVPLVIAEGDNNS